jgi:hypothetical protein
MRSTLRFNAFSRTHSPAIYSGDHSSQQVFSQWSTATLHRPTVAPLSDLVYNGLSYAGVSIPRQTPRGSDMCIRVDSLEGRDYGT